MSKTKYFLIQLAAFFVMVYAVPAVADIASDLSLLWSVLLAAVCLTAMVVCIVRGRLWEETE